MSDLWVEALMQVVYQGEYIVIVVFGDNGRWLGQKHDFSEEEALSIFEGKGGARVA